MVSSQALEYTSVLAQSGAAGLASYAAESLSWEEVKALRGPDTVGLPLGYAALPAPSPAGGAGRTLTALPAVLTLTDSGGMAASGSSALPAAGATASLSGAVGDAPSAGKALGGMTADEAASQMEASAGKGALVTAQQDKGTGGGDGGAAARLPAARALLEAEKKRCTGGNEITVNNGRLLKRKQVLGGLLDLLQDA